MTAVRPIHAALLVNPLVATAMLLALGACHGSKPAPGRPGAAGTGAGAAGASAAGAAGSAAGSGASGMTGAAGAAGGGVDAATAGAAGATDAGAEDVTPPCTGPTCTACGFIMPNPVGSGLPNPASYTVGADGTVIDGVTGLVWEGTLGCASYNQPTAAAAYCTGRGPGWRLPTRLELRSIVDDTRPAPKIDPVFVNRTSERFWVAPAASGSKVISFSNGGTQDFTGLAFSFRARCVHDGSRRCFETRFEPRAGGLVYDRTTALTWQQTLDPGSYTWADATAYCAGVGAGWRLPSVGELETIIDETKAPSSTGTAIDLVTFPGTPRASFWTSTRGGGAPWSVDFSLGRDAYNQSVDLQNRVRCVRGGAPPAAGADRDAGTGAPADAAPEAAPPPALPECRGHIDGDLVCVGAEIHRCAAGLSSAPLVQACAGAAPTCVGGACVSCANPARCECGGFAMPNTGAGLPNRPSYTTHPDGTVTDNVTGLVWEGTVSETGGPVPKGSVADCSTNFTQAAAAAYCAGKGSTWRLPTRIELISLADYTIGQPGPAIDSMTFPSTPEVGFWSSTPSMRFTPGEAWFFDFGTVESYTYPTGPEGTQTGRFRVRCVHAGTTKCYPTRFTSQPDAGTVLDRATGLSWELTIPGGSFTWAQAQAHCVAKGTGWRLPSVPEALALVDDTRVNPALDKTVFPDTLSGPDTPDAQDSMFWTSTPVPEDSTGTRWLVDFSDGVDYGGATELGHSVRCVR